MSALVKGCRRRLAVGVAASVTAGIRNPSQELTFHFAMERESARIVLPQPLEERLGLCELRRVKSLSEPAVDRREEVIGFGALALVAP
jgi:hypothetical protein